jgi:hypothetical protein
VPEQFTNDDTRAIARLPGLDIEITHSRLPNAERISIHLQATPSFEAFGRFLETANPLTFWAQAIQMMWMPWLNATSAMMPDAGTSETQQKLPRR